MSFIQNTDKDRTRMLEAIGVSSFEQLLEPIPPDLRIEGELNIPPPSTEPEVRELCGKMAGQNNPASGLASFLGGGIYDRYIPAVVRYVLSRSEFYTAYTPYQAEVSQGTLQAIYEYQTLIARLTGMDASNASLYDGAMAMAEAMIMACGIKRRDKIILPGAFSPRVRQVLQTYADPRGIEIGEITFTSEGVADLDKLESMVDSRTAAVVVAQPNYLGLIEPAPDISEIARQNGSLVVAYVDPVSLAVLSPPGEYGADIAVGEGQSLGNPQNLGGPLLGFMAVKKKYIRKVPGRLISGTVDRDGKRGYVMTLQTREQHIRRERATSNICTNEGLCALAASVYLTALGEEGFREVAMQSMSKSHTLYSMLSEVEGCNLPFGKNFFQEFVAEVEPSAGDFIARARKKGILAGIPLGPGFDEFDQRALLVAVTEKRNREELELYRDILVERGE